MTSKYQQTMRLPSLPRTCPACHAPLPDDGRFCSSCGASTKDETRVKEQRPKPEALLAEANLLRARRDWATAEERCIDVIRIDHHNVHAHSLLGDINRDQGRLEEAGQWYQLALDLDPGSHSDRNKLKEIEDELAKSVVHSFSGGGSNPGTQKLAGLTPTLWIKALWALLAVFLIASVILTVSAKNKQKAANQSSDTILRYGSMAEGPQPTSATASPRVPFRLPQYGLPVKQTAPISSTPTQTSSQPPPVLPTNTGSSEQEAALQGMVTRQGNLPQDTTIASLVLDPRQDRATAVVSLGNSQAVGESLKERAVRAAFRAAFSLCSANSSIQHVTINVRMGNSLPIFAGDADRAGVQRATDTGDTAHLLTAFSNVWWNTNLVGEDAAPTIVQPTTGNTGESAPPPDSIR